jgi:DNA-directed RNA polymerase specialized sigma24 family protein
MEPRKYIVRTKSYRVGLQHNYSKLRNQKLKDDSNAFYEDFVKTIPALRMYINASLNNMEDKGQLLSNLFVGDDFVDELFIAVYEKFESFKTAAEFYTFMFIALNSILERAAATETSLHDGVENIDVYEEIETDKMRKKITAQLDGDIVFMDDLDDISYSSKHESFTTVFEIDTENELDNRLDSDLTYTWTSKQINGFISSLPRFQKNIAMLYLHFHLTVAEIVTVTNEPRNQVFMAIDGIKKRLKIYLFNN